MPLPSQASELSANYGGPFQDYHPVEDPTTDLGADKLNQALSDVAAMSHTAGHAWVSFDGHAYSGSGTDAIVVVDHDSMWGSSLAVKPTVGCPATGRYVVTWPASVNDSLGNVHQTNVRKPRAWVEGALYAGIATTYSHTSNTITVECTNYTGTSVALAGYRIYVEW